MAIERTGLNRLKEYVRAVHSLLTSLFYQPNCLLIKSVRTQPWKGIKIFENEIKLSQFADDTTLFNADLGSLEKTLKIVEDFGKLAGLYLNVKKTKAIWLGKWMNNKNKPLNISWFHCPVKNSWDPFFL